MSLGEATEEALRQVPLTPVDAAAAELARTYAAAIDAGEDLAKAGPALLACLESLGMTPRARRTLLKGASDAKPKSPIDEVKERRDRRRRQATE